MQACEFDYSGTQACKALKCDSDQVARLRLTMLLSVAAS